MEKGRIISLLACIATIMATICFFIKDKIIWIIVKPVAIYLPQRNKSEKKKFLRLLSKATSSSEYVFALNKCNAKKIPKWRIYACSPWVFTTIP